MQRRHLVWISLGFAAVLLRLLLAGYPEIIERYYSRGLFVFIRWIIDYTVALLPFPLLYIFVAVLLFYVVIGVRRMLRSPLTWPKKVIRAGFSLLAFTGGLVFFFLFLWGFNYARVPIESQLDLEIEPLVVEEIKRELESETKIIIKLRNEIPTATEDALDRYDLPEDLESQLREGLKKWFRNYGFPTPGRVRALQIYPKGIFLRFSSSGLYFPYTGEGQVDAGLHPLQWPYVLTHEMAHGYGFGDEGTCNFLAFVACSKAHDPAIAYMGHLAYWRTLAVNYLRYEPEEYAKFRATLPVGIRADLDAINENLAQYPDIMPGVRNYAYDAYLKAQGIDEGIKNYNRVIMLVKSWRQKKEL